MDNSKKPVQNNPRKGANFLSVLIFYWFIPLLWKGTRKGLNMDDITVCLDSELSEVLGAKLEREWKMLIHVSDSNKLKKPQILRKALFNTFFPSIIFDGFIIFTLLSSRTIGTFFLGQLLNQYQKLTIIKYNETYLNFTESRRLNNSSEFNKTITNELSSMPEYYSIIEYIWNDKFSLSLIVILLYLLSSICAHHTDLRQRMVGTRIRIACSSLIYRKTLRLSKKSCGQTGAGHLINLLSNDVSRFDIGFVYVHYIWLLPIQSCIVCYLLWQNLGIAALVAIGSMLLLIVPTQLIRSHLLTILRNKIALKSSLRIGIMNDLIQGIQVIKMHAWENSFKHLVHKIRQSEMKQIHFASCLRGIHSSADVFVGRLVLLLAILAMILLGQNLSAPIIYTLVQHLATLQTTVLLLYSAALAVGAEALVAITRIQEYLLLEEKDDQLNGYTQIKLNSNEINNSLKLNAIEIINVSASWKNDSTVDQLTLNNILLNVKVGQLCAIIGPVGSGKTSLLHLLLGELPILSGNCLIKGNMSYASQESWLFSDTIINNILFGETFDQDRYNEIIECCALKTDLNQLEYGDRTNIGEKGTALSGGQRARINLARAIYKSAEIYLLDDPLSSIDVHVGASLFDKIIGPYGYLACKQKSTRLLVTHQVHFLKEADIIIVIENGKIMQKGTFSELTKSNFGFTKLLQKYNQNEINEKTDEKLNDVKEIVKDETAIKSIYNNYSDNMLTKTIVTTNSDIVQNDTVEIQNSVNTWRNYFKYGGNMFKIITFFTVTILAQTLSSVSDYFLSYWIQQEFYRQNHNFIPLTTYEYFYVHSSIVIVLIMISLTQCFLFFNITTNASINIHNQMFINLINAPMMFFDKIPLGNIINRFSNDIGNVDEFLPRTMHEAQVIFSIFFGIILVIIVNPMMALAVIVTLILYALIIKLISRPSQELVRLEGITLGNVFSYFSNTLIGLTTIRACGLQEKLTSELDSIQNVFSAVRQMTCSSMTVLCLWLDFVIILFSACVMFSYLFFKDETFSGNIGLAITKCLALTGVLQYGVKLLIEVYQNMISTGRVLEYTKLEQEFNPEKQPPSNWPENGKIQFNNMSLKYDKKNSTILKNIQLDIESKWKIGIVGRTGAGKSSLINALFRLSIIEGEILIDGLDTSSISLESLRSKISIIPQDPFLFAATIRFNLDPFRSYDDHQLWNVLENVELKKSISSLDDMITEGGNNFSVGQRQLLCLARAMLCNNKILVLDEATANVDPQTDELIQHTIRNKFNHCTILMIAHRLHTVIDADRIIVMDKGEVKEFDVPYLLLENKKGILANMINATGTQDSTNLKKIANQKFKRK